MSTCGQTGGGSILDAVQCAVGSGSSKSTSPLHWGFILAALVFWIVIMASLFFYLRYYARREVEKDVVREAEALLKNHSSHPQDPWS